MEDGDRVTGTARIAFPGDPNLLILGVGDEWQVDLEGPRWQAGLLNGVTSLTAAGGRVYALLDKKLLAAISPLIVAPYGGEKGPKA